MGLIIGIIMLGAILTVCFISAVAVGALAISKDYFIELKTSTNVPIVPTRTTAVPKWNNCTRFSDSSPTFPNQAYSPFTRYTTKFKKGIIQAFVEICLPESYFIINFGDRLVLTDENGIIRKTVPINVFLNKNNTHMSGTKNELIVSDGSSFLYRYTFDLDVLEPKNFESALIPVKLSSLFYDFATAVLYVYQKNVGIHKMNLNLEIFETIPLAFNTEMLFVVYNLNKFKDEIYFGLRNNRTMGLYSGTSKIISFIPAICENDTDITSFLLDPDNFLYTACSLKNITDATDDSYSSIKIKKFGGDELYNQLWTKKQITTCLLDTKNRLAVSTYDGTETALEFLF